MKRRTLRLICGVLAIVALCLLLGAGRLLFRAAPQGPALSSSPERRGEVSRNGQPDSGQAYNIQSDSVLPDTGQPDTGQADASKLRRDLSQRGGDSNVANGSPDHEISSKHASDQPAPIPPAPAKDQALRQPPDDVLSDVAAELVRGYQPAGPGENATLRLDLRALASRYAIPMEPISPTMLSLAYYFSASPLVHRLQWHAKAAGHEAEALRATAATVRALADCQEPAQSPNCAFALEFMGQLTAGRSDATTTIARARTMLIDLAARLERAAGT